MSLCFRSVTLLACAGATFGCTGSNTNPVHTQPLATACVLGLLVANAFWFSKHVSWRRFLLGNVLLLVVTYLVLSFWGCPDGRLGRWSIHGMPDQAEPSRQVWVGCTDG
jgi:hypothetical protein